MQTIDTRHDAPAPSIHDAVLASFRGEPHRFLDVTPHRIAYRRFGSGPDLVFVHGWPLHSGTFRALVPLLAERFTCHLVDLPGSGRTESPADAPLDFPTMARTLRAAVDALGLTRYALVAHDSGGFVARLLAAEDPRVAALVSGDTEIPGHTPDVIKALLVAARAPGGAEVVRIAMRTRAMRRSSMGYGGCFADLECIDGDFHELMVAPLLASRHAWKRQVDILRTIDEDAFQDQMRAAHAKITAPTLFIWGDQDPIFPIDKARAMLGQLPGARLEAIPGGKCFVHEERAPEFAACAVPFLRDILCD